METNFGKVCHKKTSNVLFLSKLQNIAPERLKMKGILAHRERKAVRGAPGRIPWQAARPPASRVSCKPHLAILQRASVEAIAYAQG